MVVRSKKFRAVQEFLSDRSKKDFLAEIDKILQKERRRNKPPKVSKRPFWEQLNAWLLDESWIREKICEIEEAECEVGAQYAKTVRNRQFYAERKILGMQERIYDIQID